MVAYFLDVHHEVFRGLLDDAHFMIGHKILHELLFLVGHQPGKVGLVLGIDASHQLDIGTEALSQFGALHAGVGAGLRIRTMNYGL